MHALIPAASEHGQAKKKKKPPPHPTSPSASRDGAAGVQVLDLLLLCNSGA